MYFATSDLLSNFNTLINVAMVLAVAIGGAYIARIRLQSGKQSTDKQILRESYDDLQKVHYGDQLVINQLKKETEVLKTANDVLQKNYKTLEDIKTQAPSIIRMMRQSSDQHKEIMTAFASMTLELGNVAKAITKEHYGRK